MDLKGILGSLFTKDQGGGQSWLGHQLGFQDPKIVSPLGSQPKPTVTPTPKAVSYQPSITPQQQYSIQGFTTTNQVPQNYYNLIEQASRQTGIHPAILASLLFSEHGFSNTPGYNYNANGSYDRGPAQINTAAHPDITDQQALDPKFAIPWAAHMLQNYIKQAGGLKNGIAAYNVGVGGATVNGPGGNLGPRGQQYLGKVEQGLTPEVRQQLGL